jgi:tight adherence protein C
MLLLSALALLICGAAFIAYYFYVRREVVADRVDMIRAPLSALPAPGMAREIRGLYRPSAHAAHAPELREMGRLLARLHVPPDWTPAAMTALQIVVGLGLAALAFYLSHKVASLAAAPLVAAGLAFGFAVVGWFIVPWYLRRRVKKRIGVVETGLPEALELLVVCVEAGLSLDDALERVVGELGASRPELAEELALTSADLKILSSRDKALFNLAERVDLASVRSVVTTLAQSMRYGTPLAQALRVVASDLRNDSLIRLEERANRLPVLLTVPMMLFIMPTIFLIVGGPAALRLMDVFLH